MSLLRSLSFIFLFFTITLYAYPNYSQAIKDKKIYPMGKKIYIKKCPQINVKNYKSYDALREGLAQTKCANLNKRYKEALLLYLWDIKKVKATPKQLPSLDVTHKQKCPICGMFLYKYPRWVSMIEYKNHKKLYFDGMKDLFKYYFMHPDAIEEIFTRDYYTQKVIDAKAAYFVIGSDIYGPMGNELIGFTDKKSAEHFLMDHRGRKIVRFSDVTSALIEKLDE